MKIVSFEQFRSAEANDVAVHIATTQFGTQVICTLLGLSHCRRCHSSANFAIGANLEARQQQFLIDCDPGLFELFGRTETHWGHDVRYKTYERSAVVLTILALRNR